MFPVESFQTSVSVDVDAHAIVVAAESVSKSTFVEDIFANRTEVVAPPPSCTSYQSLQSCVVECHDRFPRALLDTVEFPRPVRELKDFIVFFQP